MEQTVKENPDVVTLVQYGQTYEKRVISLLKVKTSTLLNVDKKSRSEKQSKCCFLSDSQQGATPLVFKERSLIECKLTRQ